MFAEEVTEGAMNKGPGMNQNQKQRPRGRPNNLGGGKKHMPVRSHNQTFDSNGPEIRIRGNAHQVLEKYLALARDATAQGDRVGAENYYQHAEHYFRVINANSGANGQRRPEQRSTPADDQPSEMEGDGEENNNMEASDQGGEGSGEQSDGRSDSEQSEAVNA